MMNENVEVFVLSDWVGNVLGEYATLEEAEDRQREIVESDTDVTNGYNFYESIKKQLLPSTEALREIENLIDELESQVYEDLYIEGLDKDGNKVNVEFG